MKATFDPVTIKKTRYTKGKKKVYDFQNDREFYNKYNLLKMLAVSVFEWKNLPLSIDKNFLERTLFERGKLAFFIDENMPNEKVEYEGQMICLPVAMSYKLDVYGVPLSRRAYSVNGYQQVLDDIPNVIVYDNVLKMSMEEIICTYAERLASVERIIDVNINHTRHPYIIATSEKQKEELEAIMNDIFSNKELLITSEEVSQHLMTKVEVFKLDAPFVVDKLMDYKNTLMNEVLTIIGIGNSSQDKRERLLTDEMQNANVLNKAYANVRLKERREGLEKLKKVFPDIFKDVTVEFSTLIEDSELITELKGSVENGEQNSNDL